MAGVDGLTSARRFRERQLRSFLMALAEALHHSRDVGSEQHVAPRGQKTASAAGKRRAPLEEVAPPQGGAGMVGYMPASVPSSPRR